MTSGPVAGRWFGSAESSTHRTVSLLFRDYLRVDQDIAAQYVAVKRRLAAQFPHDGLAKHQREARYATLS
ncbi:GrpB family protein [Micromonospora sp. CPCC 206061]|uniref:GrpB family protein n=1 Tax=Micromonospora sp. CPCC 206061 TaxID=3122410 RepID=UPI002FF1CBF8